MREQEAAGATIAAPASPRITRMSSLTNEDSVARETETALTFWLSEADQLGPAHRALFLDGLRTSSFEDYISGLNHAVHKTVKSSKMFRLSKNLKPIFLLANSIAPITTSASQISPMPASLILGGITCILSSSTRLDEYQEKVIETLEWMADEVNLISMYTQEGLYEDDLAIKTCELNLATDILQFCRKVARMFYDDHGKERSGIVFALKAQCKDFDAKFGEIKIRFGQHLGSLEKRRGMANTLRMASLHSEVNGISKMLKDDHGERSDKVKGAQQGERRRRFLECLPFLNFEEIQENNDDRLVPGSGNWLLNNDEFLAWQNSTKSSLLVIRELRTSSCNPEGAALAWAYCTNTQTKTRMNLNNLLGSILRQFYKQLPLSQSVETLLSRVDDSSKEEPSRSEMKDGIRTVVSKLRSSYVIIDGLDECSHFPDRQFEDFCDFLASLAENKDSGSATRVLVFSRPDYKAISNAFSRFPQLQVDAGANDSDIKAYISHKVDEINTEPSVEESIGFAEIKNLMFSNAAGLFLWVHFKAKHFKEIGSVEDIKEALQDSTEGLDELYGGEIRKILDNPSRFIRDRALRALLWVTNSYSPLSKLELLEALSMKPGRKSLNHCQRLPRDISLTRDCADLITEVNGYYQLRHASLKDFLSSRLPALLAYGDLQNCAHSILAETCLTYINFQDFDAVSVESPEELAELKAKYPLLGYASLYWGDHFVEGNGNQSEPLNQLLNSFLSKQAAMRVSIQMLELRAFRDGLRSPGKPTALHILAIFNLIGIADSRQDIEGFLSIQDEFGHAPIEYSMLYGRREMTRWLLDEHVKEHKNGRPFSPAILRSCRAWLLHSAAEENWEDVVRDLITLGFDPNVRDLAGESPVHAAAKASANSSLSELLELGGLNDSRSLQRHTPLTLAALHMNSKGVDILLRSGACVSQPGKNEETALHHAAKFGLVDMALNLLSYGADLNAPCSFEAEFYGETPLHYAVVARMAEMVELLIQHGARLEVETTAGDTPISLACYFGLTHIFDLLSKSGADVFARNPRNRSTVLHRAAEHGNLSMIESILASPAHESLINAIDSSGNTPLLVALYQGDSEIATLLLERGANPDVVNFNRSTPLHVAIDSECIEVAKKLLATNNVGLSTPGRHGNTILHGIAAKGRTDLLPLILQQDGKHDFPNDDGFTPFHFAAAFDQVDFIRELIQLYPSVDVNGGNENVTTPLHTAARNGSIETVRFLVKLKPPLADCRDEKSRLPVHTAAAFGHAHCVAELSTTENIDTQDIIGATPLWLASRNGHYAVVRNLIIAGANLDRTSNSGLPPVSIAMANLHHHIATLLMDSGAKGTITGNDGESSLHLAARIGNKHLLDKIHESLVIERGSQSKTNKQSVVFAVDIDGRDLMAVQPKVDMPI